MSKKPIVNKITGTSPLDIKKINDNFEEVSKKMNTSEDVNLDELKVGCCCGLGNIKQYSGSSYKLQNTGIYIHNGMCFVSKSNFSHPIIIYTLSEYNGYYGAHIVIESSLCPNGMSPQKSPIFEKLLRVFIYNSRMKNNEEINIYFWTYAKNSTEADILLYEQICKNGYEYWFAYGHFGYTYDFYCVDVKLYKNVFSTVATTGSYNDLSDKPELFSGDYNDLKNKPAIPNFDGDYNNLENIPWLFWSLETFHYTAGSTHYIQPRIVDRNFLGDYNMTSINSELINATTKKACVFRFSKFPFTITENYYYAFDNFGTDFINAIKTCKKGYAGDLGIIIFNPNKETFSDELISYFESIGSVNISKNKNSINSIFYCEGLIASRFYERFSEESVGLSFLYDRRSKYNILIEDEYKRKLPYVNKNNIDVLQNKINNLLPISGNTKDTAMTGEIYLANGKGLYGVDTNGNPVRLTVHSNGTNYFGVKECTSMIRSSNNPQVMVGDNTYTMYHTGNVPKYIWSGGDKTAETGTEAPNAGYMCMNTIYNNGYPCTYGNLLTLSGSGKSELAMEWTGNDTPTTGRLYYRSKRDTGGVAWGAWKKIAYSDDVPNKSYTSMALEFCARSSDTGNSNTNKYFKLATYTIDANYGNVSAEYSVGFNGHGMSTSPHHKIGVWVKRQDSNFHMDLKVWGATNDNYATYLLVKTGTYQATLYAFLRTQYCTLYMSCLSRMYNSATVQYYTGATPINTVGSTNVYGTYMDKPSVTGGVECIFSGSLKSTGALDNAWKNKGTCVDSNGYFNVPEDGVYHIIGRAWKTNSVYLCNVTTGSKAPMPMLSNLAPSDSTIITFNTPFKGTKNESYLLRQDEIGTKLNYAVFTILKLN